MYTIGQIAKSVGLSRGTLLHYDKIGLLKSSARTEANYRTYTHADLARLQQIMLYREAGLPLEKIAQLLETSTNETLQILQNQLTLLNEQIVQLRQQQQMVLSLIGNDTLQQKTRVMNKAQWVSILQTAGWSEADMQRWHATFEQNFPEAHQDFLESLGIAANEIAAIQRGFHEV